MNQEQKRIKIAEACGWREVHWDEEGPRTPFASLFGRPRNVADNDSWCEVPDYFNSLDACHQMEKVLRCPNQKTWDLWEEYCRKLEDDPHATASQRAEAFGLTLGLWKGGE